MPRWRWRWRGRIGRPCLPIYLGFKPIRKEFVPTQPSFGSVYVTPPELEALRLVDLEGLTQEEAGERMGVSRGTVWRLLQTCRKKIAEALVRNKTIVITEERV